MSAMTAGLGFEMVKVTPGIAARYYGKCVRTLARWFDKKCVRLLSSDSLDRPYRSHRRYWVPKWWQNGQPLEPAVSVLPEAPICQEVEVKRTYQQTLDEIESLEMTWNEVTYFDLCSSDEFFKGLETKDFGNSLKVSNNLKRKEAERMWSLLFLRAAVWAGTDETLISSIKQESDIIAGARLLEKSVLVRLELPRHFDRLCYDTSVEVEACLFGETGIFWADFRPLRHEMPLEFSHFIFKWCKEMVTPLVLEGQDLIDFRPLLDVVKETLVTAVGISVKWKY